MDIEKEIEARVEFKMNELLTGIKNVAKTNWHIAFNGSSQKHSYYWEAFTQMEEMFHKEMKMALPYPSMEVHNRKQARDKAVRKITDRLNMRGTRDSDQITRVIVEAVEQAQNF